MIHNYIVTDFGIFNEVEQTDAFLAYQNSFCFRKHIRHIMFRVVYFYISKKHIWCGYLIEIMPFFKSLQLEKPP